MRVRRIEALEGGHAVPLVREAPLLSSSISPGKEYSWKDIPRQRKRPNCGSCLLFFSRSIQELRFNKTGAMRENPLRTLTTPGAVHLLTPGPVRSLSHRDPLDCIVLTLEPGYFHRALDDSLRGEKIDLIDRFALEDAQIERMVKALHAETRAGAPTGTLFGQSIATALAVYLAQRYAPSVPTLRPYRGGIPRTRLNLVLEYIARKLQDDLSLAALADVAGMNYFYFSRLFKQSTGLSPQRYVLEQRIRRAQQFLRTSDMTILEASVRAGFADQGHFTKAFRRFVGVTPTEYRVQCAGRLIAGPVC